MNIYDNLSVFDVETSNGIEKVTLKDLFLRAGEIKKVTSRNISAEMAIFQLLICLVGTYSLRSGKESIDGIDKYLEKYKDYFDLRVFLQSPYHKELAKKDSCVLAKFLVEEESGQNGSFFSGKSDLEPETRDPQEILNCILIAHCFAAAGMGGGLPGKNKVYSRTIPFRCTNIYLKGDTLKESLELNIKLMLPIINEYKNSSFKAIWETDDFGESFIRKSKKDDHIPFFLSLGYERLMKIVWEGTKEAPTAKVGKLAQGAYLGETIVHESPFSCTRIDEKTKSIIPVRASVDRKILRCLPFFTKDINISSSPKELDMSSILADKSKIFGVSTLNLPAYWLSSEESRKAVEEAIEYFEKLFYAIKISIKNTFENASTLPKALKKERANSALEHFGFSLRFWADAEKVFLQFIENIKDKTLENSMEQLKLENGRFTYRLKTDFVNSLRGTKEFYKIHSLI